MNVNRPVATQGVPAAFRSLTAPLSRMRRAKTPAVAPINGWIRIAGQKERRSSSSVRRSRTRKIPLNVAPSAPALMAKPCLFRCPLGRSDRWSVTGLRAGRGGSESARSGIDTSALRVLGVRVLLLPVSHTAFARIGRRRAVPTGRWFGPCVLQARSAVSAVGDGRSNAASCRFSCRVRLRTRVALTHRRSRREPATGALADWRVPILNRSRCFWAWTSVGHRHVGAPRACAAARARHRCSPEKPTFHRESCCSNLTRPLQKTPPPTRPRVAPVSSTRTRSSD
jgi:hypothetical protein